MKWLLPPVLFVFSLIAMGALAAQHQYGPLLAWPWPYVGLAPLAAGVVLLLVGSRQFRRAETNINTFRDPDVPVTSGAFAITRNPMYLGFVLVLTGTAFLMNALCAFAPVIAFFIVTHVWYIPFEERSATAQFGDAYLDYKRRVRRWI